MKRGIVPVLFLVLSFSFSLVGAATLGDSVGVERKGTKTLILHQVESGQTLFAISRRYRVPVDEIRAENAGLGTDLQPGQVVKVPWTPPSEGHRNSPGTHRVATGESLFGIARQHQVSVENLRQWNGLSDNSINVGDELAVSPGLTKKTPAADAPVVETPLVGAQTGNIKNVADSLPADTAERKTHAVAPGQTLNAVAASPVKEAELRKVTAEKLEAAVNRAEDHPTESVPNNSPAIPVPNANIYQRKVEVGLAELIEGTQANEKYLALHRTAPVGTIVQVKNLMNELSIFAKVIGRLPNTGANEKIAIRISGKAYERLAAVDKKFRVEISYVP